MVQLKSEGSDELPIDCGAQQGSILGPLLFIFCVKGENIAPNQSTLNSEMNICFTQNKLHLNVSRIVNI